MKCARAADLISDYIDDELPGSLRLELELHVRDCSQCSKALEDTRQVLQCLSGLSKQRVGIDCWPGIRAEIAQQAQRGGSWLTWLTRPVAWAPAFALTLLVAVLVFMPLKSQRGVSAQNPAAVEYKTYITAHSKLQRQYPLNDPDVAFITAEIENASYSKDMMGR